MSDGVPFIITPAQKLALGALGYTDAAIAAMTQAQAHELLKVNGRTAASAQSNIRVNRLSAAEIARLNSWILEIATAARGEMREGSGEWRFGANQALVLHSGGWFYDFAAGKGGQDALDLLTHLHGGDGSDAARAWLSQHAGDGRLGRAREDDEDEAQSADDAERVAYVTALWERAQPLSPPAFQYLNGRSLDPVATGAEAQLRWLPGWRGEEGAMLAAVTDDAGVVVALQATCIALSGEKSAIEPARLTLRGPHDWRSRGTFRLGSSEAEELLLVEGVEDAIAAHMAGAERVHACLGVGALGRAQLPRNVTRTIVCRDDDTPGSEACKALGRGVGRILLQGRQAAVTPRAGTLAVDAKDINDLWRIDVELARLQLAEAASPQVMLHPSEKEALLDLLSRAETDAYENGRVAAAAALGWRASVLDKDRDARRRARAKQGDDPVTQNIEATPWPDPVTDLGAVLDEAVREVKRFLVVPNSAYLDTIALWAAHTHLVPRKELGVEYTPRFGFQSPIHECGKSTGLKCVHFMSHNPRAAASITSSAMFRAVDAFGISLMVEEGDQVFKGANPDLLAIMNAGADKMLAKVMRSEKTDEGKFVPREFSCFAPVAFTSIKQVPKTLQSRSIVLRMRRAAQGERWEQLTLRTRGTLIDIGRRFMRWAADLGELPDPDLPKDLFNRIEDRWFVLFQIAGLAGGDWLERCRKAAMADLALGKADAADGGPDGDLLRDVWQVFHASKKPRMFTKEICSSLLALDESPWTTTKHGQPVDEYYLKAHLRDFLPEDAEKIAPRKWTEGKVQARGFDQLHLEDAFRRYLSEGLPCPSPPPQQNQTAQPTAKEDGSSKEAFKHPPTPSSLSADGDRCSISKGYERTDTSSRSVRPSPGSVRSPSDADGRTDDKNGRTDAEGSSVHGNTDENQQLNGERTDGTDPRGGSQEGNAPPADPPPDGGRLHMAAPRPPPRE
jgi:putative DNA primase/helicase